MANPNEPTPEEIAAQQLAHLDEEGDRMGNPLAAEQAAANDA